MRQVRDWLGRLQAQHWVLGLSVVLLLWLVLVPLGGLIRSTFVTAKADVFTWQNWVEGWDNIASGDALWNTIKFALISSSLSLCMGTAVAWVNERTDVPLKALYWATALVPIILPGVLNAYVWQVLAAPKVGFLNQGYRALTGSVAAGPFNAYSLGGMAWVEALIFSPLVFLMMASAFRSMDPSLEESARMTGASRLRTFFTITLGVNRPALIAAGLIALVRALEAFEVPLVLGFPARVNVMSTAIFWTLRRYPPEYGVASVYAVMLVGLSSVGIYLYTRMTQESRRFATVTGKGYRPAPVRLGPWRYPVAVLMGLYAFVVTGLPFLVLIWNSLMPYTQVPSVEALKAITWRNYHYIFTLPAVMVSLRNSLVLATAAATLVTVLSLLLAWLVIRTRVRGRWLVDTLAFIPMTFPGIVLAVAFIQTYAQMPVQLLGTMSILILAVSTRYLPYGMRANSATLMQIHPELEEAAAVSGVSWGRRLRDILVPLIGGGLVSAWVYVFIYSFREISSTALLYSARSQPLSIVLLDLWYSVELMPLAALGTLMISGLLILLLLTRWLLKDRFVQFM